MSYTVQAENFESVESEWEEILPQCEANTIFVTPLWQKMWWRRFGGEGADLRVLRLGADGDRFGIAPLMRGADGVISFLGSTDLFDYHDFLVVEGKESAFYDALWAHLETQDWQTLELLSLREGSPTLELIPKLAERAGLETEISEEDRSPYRRLPQSWDEYVASLRKKDRHELRRKLRRLNASGDARQYACTTPDEVAAAMDDFFALMRASRADKDDFMTAEREQFFREAAFELASRGLFRLFFLEVDGKRVASCICFDYAGSYLLYNSGYDPAYSSLSVGLLNKALAIKDAIEQGRETFDFLRGTERYKYNLGGQDQSVYRLVVRR